MLQTLEPPDEELVEATKVDPQAFGRLYDRHVERIYNYILFRVGDRRETEDLTARTFQRALMHVHGYEDRGLPFSAWLYRIAHNLVANWHRDARRGLKPLAWEELDGHAREALHEPGELDEQLADSLISRHQLLGAVQALGEDRQALLIYKFNQGMSNAEIARLLGRTEGAVKSLYYRTLIDLRALLGGPATENEGHDDST